MATCAHEDFLATCEVARIQHSDEDPTIIGFAVELIVHCAVCDESMVFIGAPIGSLADRPTISADGTTARWPVRPQSSDPHFGMGVAGFLARVAEGDEHRGN